MRLATSDSKRMWDELKQQIKLELIRLQAADMYQVRQDNLVSFYNKMTALESEAGEECCEWILRNNEAYSLRDILGLLINASEILLTKYDYDGDGHERISHAQLAAKDLLSKLESKLIKVKE